MAWFCSEIAPGVAQIQTLFTANPLPHPGRQGEGNIFAHKAFYKPEQWGMDRKGLKLIQCWGGNSFNMWEEKNQVGNVTTGDWKQPSEGLVCTFHSWRRADPSGTHANGWAREPRKQTWGWALVLLSWMKVSSGMIRRWGQGKIRKRAAISASQSTG